MPSRRCPGGAGVRALHRSEVQGRRLVVVVLAAALVEDLKRVGDDVHHDPGVGLDADGHRADELGNAVVVDVLLRFP